MTGEKVAPITIMAARTFRTQKLHLKREMETNYALAPGDQREAEDGKILCHRSNRKISDSK